MEQVRKEHYQTFCKHLPICDLALELEFLQEIQAHYDKSEILLSSMMDLKGDGLANALTFHYKVINHLHLGSNCLWFHQGEHWDSICHKFVDHRHLGAICLWLHQGVDWDFMKRQCFFSWSSLVSLRMITKKGHPEHAIFIDYLCKVNS
jgi:hypothetical protein